LGESINVDFHELILFFVFCRSFLCAAGGRVMSITVNGEPFATDLDVFAEVGCNRALLITESYTANIDGIFVIALFRVIQKPMVSLIEIRALEASDAPSEFPTALPSGVPTSSPSDGPFRSPSNVPTGLVREGIVLEKSVSSESSSPVFIDAGADGEDVSLISGTRIWTSYFDQSIANVPMGFTEDVFKSHRSGNTVFTYTIPGFKPFEVATVFLGFAENYEPLCGLNERIFTVEANGQIMALNLDVFAVAGCNTATSLTATIAADDQGRFVLDFEATRRNPMVAVIYIEPVSLTDTIALDPAGPSDSPSSVLSDTSSDFPSDTPSSVPSNFPSGIASSVPSDRPSSIPSIVPSDLASDISSSVPGDVPSGIPSSVPSDEPSSIPSTVPSDFPSGSSSSPATTPDLFIDAGTIDEDTSSITGNIWTSYFEQPIANVPDGFDEASFKDHRSGNDFTYVLDGFEAGATAEITLGFAENYVANCYPGKRVFGITVNGQVFADALDVYGAVGCSTALIITKPFAADATGSFVIEFIPIKEHPMVCLIAIHLSTL
jgi:Malectin domain